MGEVFFATDSELEKEVRELEPVGFLTCGVGLDNCSEDGEEQKRIILMLNWWVDEILDFRLGKWKKKNKLINRLKKWCGMELMKRGDNVERSLAVSKEKVDIVWEADLAQGYDTKQTFVPP